MGWIRKVQKHKKERMEERKRRDFYSTWRFLYSCVLHCSRTPSAYHHCATLPQENPLVWEPPLQKTTTTQIGVWNKVSCQVSVFFSLCWFACNLKPFWKPFVTTSLLSLTGTLRLHNTSAGEFLFWLTKHKIVSICCCCCCCCYVKKQTLSSPQLSIRFHKIYFPQIIC